MCDPWVFFLVHALGFLSGVGTYAILRMVKRA